MRIAELFRKLSEDEYPYENLLEIVLGADWNKVPGYIEKFESELFEKLADMMDAETVNCKDCRFSPDGGWHCNHFCVGHWDTGEEADYIYQMEVNPHGSCSWGERRTDGKATA